MTIAPAYFVVSRYVETLQVDKKAILRNSPTLFSTFNYPGYSDNKRLRLAHESTQKTISRRT
jgi:hypothetical protein